MWQCLECGKKFKTVKAAERASYHGCPKCGGVDVDFVVSPKREEREPVNEGRYFGGMGGAYAT